MVTEATIQEAVRRIAEQFHPVKVILFGSQARGTAGPRSDIDLLVLVDEADGHMGLAGRMYSALSGMQDPIDIVVMAAKQFEEYKDFVGTVARPAAREGRVVYQRAA